MAKISCSAGRAILFTAVLLIIAGGVATGIYFGVRNNGKRSTGNGNTSGSPGPAGTPGSKPSSAVPFSKYETSNAVNFASRNDPIERQAIFYGLSYSPYGLGDNRVCPPFDDVGGVCLLPGQVLADIRTISSLTKRVKLYSLDCYLANRVVLEYAKANGMSVMLGLFITKDQKKNDKEISRFQDIANTYGNSSAISEIVVGNEAIFVEGASVAQLTSAIASVRAIASKAGITAPIGCAEVYSVWAGKPDAGSKTDISTVDFSPLLEAVEWIGLNAHPYYSGQDPLAGDAGKKQIGSVQALSAVLKSKGVEKPVYITETGFPDKGPPVTGEDGSATPSAEGMQAFATELELARRAAGIPTYYFEPMNGDWKRRWLRDAREIDFNFGLFYCNRSLKALKLPPAGAL
jgi:exo-beta-1,3-glucanase (GH17 family)